jgi:predicted ATPase
LDNIPYCGRANELTILCELANEVDKLKNPKVIFICGDSGCGKTSLCAELKKVSQNRCFVSGKFDEIHRQPYSAVREALAELCFQLLQDAQIETIREMLREYLGGEDGILCNALPECRQILGTELEPSKVIDSNGSFAFCRLTHSFASLLKSSLILEKTIVMCLDDLQWADQESLDLIRYLLQDSTLTTFLFIGTLRSNQGCSLNRDVFSVSLHSHFIYLNDFDVSQVNGLLSTVLEMRVEKTESLANIIHAKCGGNPYFSLQLLKLLESRKLIHYSIIHFSWEWDIEAIQASTDVGDNLVDAILERMNCLPSSTRNLLTIASCLGGKFDALLLERLCRCDRMSDFTTDINVDNVCHDINVALHERVIERQKDSSVYRFAHDKVHQTFYTSITNKCNQKMVHLALGFSLLSLQTITDSDNYERIFLTVNQMNHCLHLITEIEEKLVIAKLNLSASNAAIASSAFCPAADFLSHGLSLLNEDCEEGYQIRLDLLIRLAKTQLCLGRLSDCHRTVNEVLQAAKSKEERIPVFEVCVNAYGAASNLVMGIKVGLEYVEQLGVKVPRHFNKVTVFRAFFKTKAMMKEKTENDILNYRIATDPFMIAAMKIISTLTNFTFQSEMMDAMITLMCINTMLSFKYGFVEESGAILSNFGLVLAFVGNFREAHAIGEACLKLSEKTNNSIPNIIMNFYGGLNHLYKPLQSSLESLLRGYRIGFEIGDTVNGFYCCLFYLQVFYFVGLPLTNLLKDIKAFSEEMRAYNITVTLDYLKVYHQSVLNLTSQSIVRDPTMLDGTLLCEEAVLTSDIKKVIMNFWLAKLILAICFQNLDVLSECLERLSFGRSEGVDGSMYWVSTMTWCEGLGAILLALSTGRRKYKCLARKRMIKLKIWTKKGNVNCCNFLLHLEAEQGILFRRPTVDVKIKFDSAISAARRAGLNNVAAIASERAALYFLSIQDTERASLYMMISYELYDCWGATSKCLTMIRDFPDLLPELQQRGLRNNSLQPKGTSHLGRTRYTSDEGKLHSGNSLSIFQKS